MKHGEWCLSKSEGAKFIDSNDKKSKTKAAQGPKLIDKSTVPNSEIRDSIESQWMKQNQDWIERWFVDIISPTKIGDLVGPVIDYSESWMVMRLKEKNKDVACFDAVIIEKISLHPWLEAEKAKVKIIKY